MCGRARLSTDYSDLKVRFAIPPEWPAPNVPARWNAAPTQDLVVVRYEAEAGHRRLDALRWGLVPIWAKDLKIGYTTFNAMAETAAEKPAFRDAFAKRRCLVPFDNFYEWRSCGKEKQPYAVGLADGKVMALAGLWDRWRSPEGEIVRSFTILTCPANALCATVHHRMPVILDEETWPLWLGETAADRADLQDLMAPYPAERLTMWPVGKAVGNVRNDGPELAVRIAEGEVVC